MTRTFGIIPAALRDDRSLTVMAGEGRPSTSCFLSIALVIGSAGRYQQNLGGRNIALVVLATNNWSILRANPSQIVAAVERMREGAYDEVRFGITGSRRIL